MIRSVTARSFQVIFSLSVIATGAGCAERVPTAASPCPCADGYVCCSSGVCAPESVTCDAATAALSAQAQGRWTGYIENATFDSGSDALELSFTVDANGALTGTVFVGNNMPPEAPTDPDIGWPTDRTVQSAYVEGFPYPAHDIRWEAARLKFKIAGGEAWQAWCPLQTSYPYQSGGSTFYFCVPVGPPPNNGPGTCTFGEPPQAVDCGKLRLCELAGVDPCDCSAAGCVASSYLSMSFDIALRGDFADGSLVGVGNPSQAPPPVRLVRATR